jgi:succinate dehydrogenase / fumarate reductase cytochrome b subunit
MRRAVLFHARPLVAMSAPDAKSLQASRPLSPHLQIYRWQWTMALSILHRLTGIALALGTLLLVYWLASAAAGPEAFAAAQRAMKHWLGQICLFGWTAALFYHLFNGIRHLVWDAGKGFELRHAYLSGMAVVASAVAATALAWAVGLAR